MRHKFCTMPGSNSLEGPWFQNKVLHSMSLLTLPWYEKPIIIEGITLFLFTCYSYAQHNSCHSSLCQQCCLATKHMPYLQRILNKATWILNTIDHEVALMNLLVKWKNQSIWRRKHKSSHHVIDSKLLSTRPNWGQIVWRNGRGTCGGCFLKKKHLPSLGSTVWKRVREAWKSNSE